jgi:hypothetical protein
MRERKNDLIRLTCLAFWLILVVTAENNQDDDGMGGEVSLARLSTFISLATSYLVRVCHTADQDPNFPGKFTYIAYLHKDLEFDFAAHPQETYNLLRHNGAIYSLALSYERQKDEKVLDAMTRSIDFLKNFAIGPVPDVSDNDKVGEEWRDMPDILAAWENKSVSPGISHDTAKLGGAGLALIALVSLEQIAPGTTDLDYMRQLGEFIAFLQYDNGSFTSKYVPDKGGRDTEFVSLYYPGEASLGLAYLASIEVDESQKERWIDVATRALLYLEDYRRLLPLNEVEPDHWALLATAKLLPLLDKNKKEYELMYQHGLKVVKSMLSEYNKEQLEENNGCMTLDRRTCPTSTRLEGLIAALSFIRPEERFIGLDEDHVENLRKRMYRDIRIGIKFLVYSQETVETLNMHGGVPLKYPPDGDKNKEVRVDYVQHSMSAVIAYERLLLSKSRSGFLSNSRSKFHLRHLDTSSFKFGQGFWRLVGLVVLLVVATVAISLWRKPKKTMSKEQ